MTALLLLFAAGVYNPSTPSAKPASPKAITACLAVPRADVQFVLGRPVSRPQEEINGMDSTCDYSAARGQVTITLQRLKQDVDIETEKAALKREIDGSSVRSAPGWGERAFFLDISEAGTQLHIIRGRTYLLISILGFGDAVSISPAVEKLAHMALDRF